MHSWDFWSKWMHRKEVRREKGLYISKILRILFKAFCNTVLETNSFYPHLVHVWQNLLWQTLSFDQFKQSLKRNSENTAAIKRNLYPLVKLWVRFSAHFLVWIPGPQHSKRFIPSYEDGASPVGILESGARPSEATTAAINPCFRQVFTGMTCKTVI